MAESIEQDIEEYLEQLRLIALRVVDFEPVNQESLNLNMYVRCNQFL